MVLEACMAKLLCCGYVAFGMECISGLLKTSHLIHASKMGDLCNPVRLRLVAKLVQS